MQRIQSHENGLGHQKPPPQMKFQDSNSERSDDLEQVMDSEGEENGEEDEGQNPFSKNNR